MPVCCLRISLSFPPPAYSIAGLREKLRVEFGINFMLRIIAAQKVKINSDTFFTFCLLAEGLPGLAGAVAHCLAAIVIVYNPGKPEDRVLFSFQAAV